MRSGQPYRRLRPSAVPIRFACAALLAIAAAGAAACGGSTEVETVVGPSAVRCQATLTGPTSPVPQAGGSVGVGISAARDCTWTANSEASWMQLNATSGQGDATLAVTVAANETIAARTGAIVVNNQRVTIAQDPRPCTFSLRATPQSLSSDGGRGSVSIDTLPGCAWTAASSASWLRVMTASGSGPGTTDFEAMPNADSARNGMITIGDQSVTIVQGGPDQGGGGGGPTCTIVLAPSSVNALVAGGTFPVTLTTNPSCTWNAMSSAPQWLTVAPTTGRGPATLTLTVARNTGSARSATIAAGDQLTTVQQAAAPSCTFTIDSGSASFPATGGDGRVRVTTQDGCDWTASGGNSWAHIATPRGTGTGDARYTVEPNGSASSRSVTLMIAGRSHTVTQEGEAPTCTFTLQPGSQDFPAGGGPGQFTVNTQGNCNWSASSGASWVSVSGGSGPGSQQVSFSVQANTGTSTRATTIAISSNNVSVASFNVTQQAQQTPTCTFTVQPGSQDFPAGGGPGQFTVNTQGNCNWSASSGASWVTVTGGSGSGTQPVAFSVQANTTTSTRAATITISSNNVSVASFNVTQQAQTPTCTFAVQPGSQDFPAGGGPGQFDVVTQANCTWSASSGAGWVSLSTGSGSGQQAVAFSVQANTATSSRATTIAITSNNVPVASFNVTQQAQAPTCTFTLQPQSQDFPAGGGSGSFTVNTQGNCGWSASSGAAWVSITSGSGPGTQAVSFSVQANQATSTRATTITITSNGASVGSFNVTQQAAAPTCTYSLQPTSQTIPAAGGNARFTVVTQAGCSWTATMAPNGWITLGTSSGTGQNDVTFTVQANTTGAQRQAGITVQGQTHTVTQMQ